jgi:hypothetical protein
MKVSTDVNRLDRKKNNWSVPSGQFLKNSDIKAIVRVVFS